MKRHWWLVWESRARTAGVFLFILACATEPQSYAGGSGAVRENPPTISRSANPRVRLMVLERLGRTGNPETLPVMLDALKDDDRQVREAALQAIAAVGKPAVPVLMELIYTLKSSPPAKSDSTPAPGTGEHARILQLFETDELRDLGEYFVAALVMIGQPSVRSFLELCKDPEMTTIFRVEQLLYLFHQRDVLEANLDLMFEDDEDPGDRLRAAERVRDIAGRRMFRDELIKFYEEMAGLDRFNVPAEELKIMEAGLTNHDGFDGDTAFQYRYWDDPRTPSSKTRVFFMSMRDLDTLIDGHLIRSRGPTGDLVLRFLSNIHIIRPVVGIIGKDREPDILSAAKDPDETLRAAALNLLPFVSHTDKVSILREAAVVEAEAVRQAASRSLGQIALQLVPGDKTLYEENFESCRDRPTTFTIESGKWMCRDEGVHRQRTLVSNRGGSVLVKKLELGEEDFVLEFTIRFSPESEGSVVFSLLGEGGYPQGRLTPSLEAKKHCYRLEDTDEDKCLDVSPGKPIHVAFSIRGGRQTVFLGHKMLGSAEAPDEPVKGFIIESGYWSGSISDIRVSAYTDKRVINGK